MNDTQFNLDHVWKFKDIASPPHKFCIIRHNPLIPTVFCRPPLNTGSWPWTWRRWSSSGRFSGSRRSKRSQRSEFKPLPHLFFWNSIFLPRFVNEFLFHMPRDIVRKTAWHILIYTILNTLYNHFQSSKCIYLHVQTKLERLVYDIAFSCSLPLTWPRLCPRMYPPSAPPQGPPSLLTHPRNLSDLATPQGRLVRYACHMYMNCGLISNQKL